MIQPFSIKKICEEADRPPYSKKVDEYFEEFVVANILHPFDIIINEEWRIILTLMMFKEQEGAPDGINFYSPDIIEEDKLKIYPVSINVEDILNALLPMEAVVGLYFQIISLFFLTNYPKVEKEYMVELMDKIDWQFLMSIPYPATEEEQGYVKG